MCSISDYYDGRDDDDGNVMVIIRYGHQCVCIHARVYYRYILMDLFVMSSVHARYACTRAYLRPAHTRVLQQRSSLQHSVLLEARHVRYQWMARTHANSVQWPAPGKRQRTVRELTRTDWPKYNQWHHMYSMHCTRLGLICAQARVASLQHFIQPTDAPASCNGHHCCQAPQNGSLPHGEVHTC